MPSILIRSMLLTVSKYFLRGWLSAPKHIIKYKVLVCVCHATHSTDGSNRNNDRHTSSIFFRHIHVPCGPTRLQCSGPCCKGVGAWDVSWQVVCEWGCWRPYLAMEGLHSPPMPGWRASTETIVLFLSGKEGFLIVSLIRSSLLQAWRGVTWGGMGRTLPGAFMQDVVGKLHGDAEIQGCLFW